MTALKLGSASAAAVSRPAFPISLFWVMRTVFTAVLSNRLKLTMIAPSNDCPFSIPPLALAPMTGQPGNMPLNLPRTVSIAPVSGTQ